MQYGGVTCSIGGQAADDRQITTRASARTSSELLTPAAAAAARLMDAVALMLLLLLCCDLLSPSLCHSPSRNSLSSSAETPPPVEVEVEVDAAPPRARRAASLSLCPPPTPPCRVAHAQSRSSRTGVSVSCFLPRLGRGGERGAAGARRQGQELVYCITMWKKKLKVCQAVAVAHHSTASCTQQQRGRVCGGTCMRRRD